MEIVEKNLILLVRAPNKKLFIYFNKDGTTIDYKGKSIYDNVDPFTLEDVQKSISAAEDQFKNILTLQFFTGMRIGEMSTLKWDDVDWNSKTINIQRSNKDNGEIGFPKNGKTRRVNILPPVLEALERQFKMTGLQRGFIFLSKHNDKISCL